LTYADPAGGSSVRNWPASPRRSDGRQTETYYQKVTDSSRSAPREKSKTWIHGRGLMTDDPDTS
jgi:hypothetical protein